MNYQNQQIADVAKLLIERIHSDESANILKAIELKVLVDQLSGLPKEERAAFGKELNILKQELQGLQTSSVTRKKGDIDVTAPMDINTPKPVLISTEKGSQHPLMKELDTILDIYYRMGFKALESRQIDDDFHMFGSLNFPEDHPARDEYDTFMTEEGWIAPAHTSIMQHRVLAANKDKLTDGESIAYVIPGRVFRNEDLDARHEHTFYQLEGVYVGRDINAGNLIAVLQTFFEEYYGKKMEVKTQPFYFPFTEPSFEFAIACPFCDKTGCRVCGEGWLEMLGCGMIHPNVLTMAGIDPTVYTGFAWGGGIERLVMIKHAIDDIRYFESGKLDFLRQFV